MFTSCIPWDSWIFYPHAFVVGDWVRQFEEYYSPGSIVFLKSFQTLWVVLNIIKRVSNTKKLEKSNPHDIQLLSTNLKLVKVLMQETCGGPFKLPCPFSIYPNMMCYSSFSNLGCVESCSWDLGEWHWSPISFLGDAPFFGCSTKTGYLSNRSTNLEQLSLLNFIQRLELLVKTTFKLVTNCIWHNSRPCKLVALV
jgi:hypothetical protein